ncbi:MAG: DNA phosphorothioation-associated putative methyltransferase [Thermoguttaceae bacterium]
MLAGPYRRVPALPKKTFSALNFEANRQILEPFPSRVLELGRLPKADEYDGYQAVAERFGSVGRALALLKRVTGLPGWTEIRQQRTDDLLVYLALARFRKRPPLAQLPPTLQRDMRAFFGSYAKACAEADDLLFKAGDAAAIDEVCGRSRVGKILPDDLYVHRTALDALEPILRIYEGCGRAYLGEVEGANVIKIHRRSGKISYLIYPDFDTDPHPALVRCFRLNLRSRQLDCYDYTTTANPPILHRKETFLCGEHPLYNKFARLTQQEEKHGLLTDTARIGTRSGWDARLCDSGFMLRGHRLVRRKQRAVGSGQWAVGSGRWAVSSRRWAVGREW